MELLPKQNEAVWFLKDKKTKEIIYGGAAGGGKSALGCLWIIESCQKYPETRWLIGRAKLKTLKETTLNTFFELSTKLGITNQFTYNAQNSIIKWNNGSEILLKDLFYYPSDPNFDELGSLELTGAFVDECPQIVYKCWQIVQSRIRYKLNEYSLIPKILGSGNPSKNWVYTEFYQPNKQGELKETRAFIQALPKDNPHLHKSYLDSLLALDEQSRQRLYYGNWEYDDNPNALINYENISNLYSNEFVSGGDKYIIGDIARFGNDKTVIGYWNGLRLEKIFTLDKNSIPEVVDLINKVRNEYGVPLSNIIVDEDGVGGGAKDYLKCKGFVNNSSPFKSENYQNLKTQCYYKLAEMINANNVYIADKSYKELIVEELEQVQSYKIDSDTKLKILPKDDVKKNIGRSPDFSDMLAMRMYFEFKTVSKYIR